MLTRLFIYGSLLRGQCNHEFIAGAHYAGEARTEARYALVDLGAYPGLVTGNRSIAGELYDVGPALLGQLDRFEEHPRVFVRTPVVLATGESPVFAYLFRRELAPMARVLNIDDWRLR